MLAKLRYWRNRRGLSVRELGEAAGVNPTTVSLLENEHQEARPKTVRKLAEALGIQPEELYGEDTDFDNLRKQGKEYLPASLNEREVSIAITGGGAPVIAASV